MNTFTGTRTAIKEAGDALGGEIPGGAYRPWFFNATASDVAFLKSKPLLFGPSLSLVEAGAQFGGQVVNYAVRRRRKKGEKKTTYLSRRRRRRSRCDLHRQRLAYYHH
jgi:hypothetical protein